MNSKQFQLDFRRGKFPVRFLVVASLTSIFVWCVHRGADFTTPIHGEQMIGYLLLVAFFLVVSLLCLKFFNDVLLQMRANVSVIVCWCIIVIVAAGFYLITFLTSVQATWLWQQPYFRYIDLQASGLLLFCVAFLGLPLFWIEKEVLSVQNQISTSESNQFSNLAFRIRPHFLFNTLNSVAHLINQHPARAEKALYNLADVFRVVMADKRELVPLKAELELADKYLYLEKTRLGERLQVASKVDPESLGIMVPVLLLQPLLENAVYHGIETRFKGGTINLSVQIVGKQLIIQIANPLPEGSIKRGRGSGNKVAQENLRDRINRTFDGRGTFDVHEADERYTVTIRLPL